MIDLDRAREEFFSEAQDLVEGLGRDLLALDEGHKSSTVDPDLVKEVFRAVHTIKGLAGLFSATRMATLSHALETMLDDLRLGKIELTLSVLDLLFASVQVYGMILQAEKDGHEQTIPEFDDLMTQFASRTAPRGATQNEAVIPPDVKQVITEHEEHRLRANLAEGNTIYRLKARFKLESIETGLEELKTTAKPHGEIITYLPGGGGDDFESIELEILLGSRATLEVINAALAHLGVLAEAFIKPTARMASRATVPPAPMRVPPTPLPPPIIVSGHPTPVPPALQDLFENTGAHPVQAQPERRANVIAPNPPNVHEPPSLKNPTQTVRVDITRLDDLMNSVADLSIVRADVERKLALLRDSQVDRKLRAEIKQIQNRFSRHLDALREGILKVRMVPLQQVFDKLNRIARQISREIGKQVNPVITGSDTEVDKLTIEELSDPLMHMMRNAIDHGIELPKEREAANKPITGTIAINAFQKGNHVVIEIEDDGRGIDTNRLLEKAISKGIVHADEARSMSRRDILSLIFVPGLSTKAVVSEISGRGVGMDVVRTNISKLGGVIDVQSEPGINTKFIVTLPITQAIINALIVKVADQQYAIPLAGVQDVGQLEAEAIVVIDGRETVKWRRSNKVETLQLCDVGRLFGLTKPPELEKPERAHFEPSPVYSTMGMQRPPMRNESRSDHTGVAFPYRPAKDSMMDVGVPKRAVKRKKRRYVVVISLGSTNESKRLGLIVDGLVGQQNVVIKGLGPSLKNVVGFTGATQLADQRIALVLDAPSLIEEVFSHKGHGHGGAYGF